MMFFAGLQQRLFRASGVANYPWMRLLILHDLKDIAVKSYYAWSRSNRIITIQEITNEPAFWLWPIADSGMPLHLMQSGRFIPQSQVDGIAAQLSLAEVTVSLPGAGDPESRLETQLLYALVAPLKAYLAQHQRLPPTYGELLLELELAPIQGRLALMQEFLGTVEIRVYPKAHRIEIVSVGHPEYGELIRQPVQGPLGWMQDSSQHQFELLEPDTMDAPYTEPEIWWRLAPDACGPEVAMAIIE